MNIARYWAKGTYQASDGGQFETWGWSDESVEEAQARASRRAEEISKRFSRGEELERYSYGNQNRPLREELLEVVAGPIEAPTAVITRNAYGCRILNTSDVMFIDVDFPQPGSFSQLRRTFQRWIGKAKNSLREEMEQNAIAQAEKLIQADPSCGIRVYRTYSGLRYLLTHSTFQPSSDGTAQLMDFVGADPLYQRLCRTQNSFRARLTPKPWRCMQSNPPNRFPWPDEKAEAMFRKWEMKYEKRAQSWATCEWVQTLGSTTIAPAVAPIVQFHDRETQFDSDLMLA